MLGKKTVAAVGGVKHTEVGVVCEVEEVLLIVEVVEHRIGEFFVIEGNEFLFEVEWYGGRGNVFFVGFCKGNCQVELAGGPKVNIL